jgi:hypothetical protein
MDPHLFSKLDLDPDPHLLKKLDSDPHKINTDFVSLIFRYVFSVIG